MEDLDLNILKIKMKIEAQITESTNVKNIARDALQNL